MFSADDIRTRTRRQPFQPFRIVTTTGQTYDINHADQALATRRFVTVPVNTGADGVPDQVTNVAVLHIVELQDLVPAPPAGGNGTPAGG